jgi:hypothetical protein
MKKVLILLTIFLSISFSSFAQKRTITRGATPGELYVAAMWYWINPPFMDTMYRAVYRCTEYGKKLTIQYAVDDFNTPVSEIRLAYIYADATSCVLYNSNPAYVGGSYVTQLYASFDYGKNWILRDENNDGDNSIYYFGTNVEGVIYRVGWAGIFKSINYGEDFILMENIGAGQEPGLNDCEFFSIGSSNLSFTSDCWQSSISIPIDPEYNSTLLENDIYRGGLSGEVYVSSVFKEQGNGDRTYHVSFSADTGHTFRTVYISEVYNVFAYPPYQPLFMSDREASVFYIIKPYFVEEIIPPYGLEQHLKLCIEYYRDYGETLVATYCHDITKDYGSVCEQVHNLVSEKCNENCVLLTWSEPESSLPVEGYQVFRNNDPLHQELITDTFYLDNNLPNGEYEYYVITHYTTGCISDTSNHVMENIFIAETCEPINDLTSEKCTQDCVLLTWSEPESSLQVEGYQVFRDNEPLHQELITDTFYFDNHLPNGNYEYYVVAHYAHGCVSDSSNHVRETIILDITDFKDFEDIVLHPNPTGGEFKVQSLRFKVQSIEVFDMYGRNLLSHTAYRIPHTAIDISHLQAGLYFVRITTEHGIAMKKVIKINH